jgi:hypothetical protein
VFGVIRREQRPLAHGAAIFLFPAAFDQFKIGSVLGGQAKVKGNRAILAVDHYVSDGQIALLPMPRILAAALHGMVNLRSV